MVTVTIVEPNITPEENEENLRQTLEILQNIADNLAKNITPCNLIKRRMVICKVV